jgi:hypothetical protein
MRRIVGLTVLLLLINNINAQALTSTRYFNGSAIMVNVAIGRITEVIMPEKIAKVIKGGNADSILVEVLNNSIFLLPKTSDIPDIFVVTINGQNIPLHLFINQEFNERLEIQFTFSRTNQHMIPQQSALELMKVMMQNKVPPGAEIQTKNQELKLFNDQLKLTLKTVFDLGAMQGLIFNAENLTNNMLIIPLEQLSYPGLIMIAAQKDSLEKRASKLDSTLMYMVIKNDKSR